MPSGSISWSARFSPTGTSAFSYRKAESNTRVATVSAPKRMDEREAVVQPHRNLMPGPGLVLYPVSRVATERWQLLLDLPPIDSDVGSPRAVSPCPLPGVAKHPLVELEQASDREQLAAKARTSARPLLRLQDVPRLTLV